MTKTISCYNCQAYPLCRQFTDVVRILDNNSICNSKNSIIIAMAKCCTYYKEVQE